MQYEKNAKYKHTLPSSFTFKFSERQGQNVRRRKDISGCVVQPTRHVVPIDLSSPFSHSTILLATARSVVTSLSRRQCTGLASPFKRASQATDRRCDAGNGMEKGLRETVGEWVRGGEHYKTGRSV